MAAFFRGCLQVSTLQRSLHSSRLRRVRGLAWLAVVLAVALQAATGSVLGGVDLSNFQQEHSCSNASVRIVRCGRCPGLEPCKALQLGLGVRELQLGRARAHALARACVKITQPYADQTCTCALRGRPRNVGDVQAAVLLHDAVQASGEPQPVLNEAACPGQGDSPTELRVTRSLRKLVPFPLPQPPPCKHQLPYACIV